MQNSFQTDRFIAPFLKYLCKNLSFFFLNKVCQCICFPRNAETDLLKRWTAHSIPPTAQLFIKHNDWVEGGCEETNHRSFFMLSARALKTHTIKLGESGTKGNLYFPNPL